MDTSEKPTVVEGGAAKPLTEKELKKKAEKAAKLEKFNAKQALKEAQKKEREAKSGEPGQADASKKKVEKVKKTAVTYDVDTPAGDKKDVSGPMPDSYCPEYVEAAWYSWWEKEGFFKPEYYDKVGRKSTGQFMMVIPPPNVTGCLHVGHALMGALEDAITRWHRMCGKTTLWLPGCDHAGIATQVVVEKKLMKERKLTRHDLGREAFVEEVWKWKTEKGDRIYHQLKKLGISADWERARFTMDPKMIRAVTEAFVVMYERGLIERDNRLVNWSCSLNSAISEIEVDKIELTGRTFLAVPGYKDKVEFGVLVSFAYKVEDSDEEIVVATTRIETMLGDTAVAVHSEDPRYKSFHGKYVTHPFVNRRIPIVCDDTAVLMDFGTGAVKITPAHDPTDFEVGNRHNLPFINIMDDAGCLCGDCGEFTGMRRFEARLKVVEALKERGLYRGTAENPGMKVPVCSRSKDIVEPLLKPQWYVRVADMSRKSVEAVKTGTLKIIPAMHEKSWYGWLENPRDWCISRQLWWGHRIPAYFVQISGLEDTPESRSENDRWVIGRTEEEALEKAVARFNVPKDTITLVQDHDVLDTWFSSGLFPFSVLGWPEKTPDLERFYPGSLLETGKDILTFWVTRMVMMGEELMGALPFTEVFLHSMVRDAHGRKMSKTLGNVVDPIDVIRGITLDGLHQTLEGGNLDPKEVDKAKAGQKKDYPQGIPECGTDALRFGLCASNMQGNDLNLDILRVQGYRFFCNKLWNASKLALMALGDNYVPPKTAEYVGSETLMDKWILGRLADAAGKCMTGFQNYEFPAATTACHHFWLYELCDVYLEYMKPIIHGEDETAKVATRATLYTCLDAGLKLLHPFMPFLTEELYQRLPRRSTSDPPSICVTAYPVESELPFTHDEALSKEVDCVFNVVKCIRSIKADYQLTNKSKVEVTLKGESSALTDRVKLYTSFICTMTSASTLEVQCGGSPPDGCVVSTVKTSTDTNLLEVHLLLKGIIDIPKELERMEKKREAVVDRVSKLKQTMARADYCKVPEQVQTQNSERLDQSGKELEQLAEALKRLSLMGESS